MKSYLEIQVPLRYDAQWFKMLRNVCKGIPVRWQKGYYHITLVFLDETPANTDLSPILAKHLTAFRAPRLKFDKLETFVTKFGMHVVYLTSSNIPHEFGGLVQSIREDLKAAGGRMESDFKLHVTLGRIKDSRICLKDLQNVIGLTQIPSFTLQLKDVDYRVFRGGILYQTTFND